MACPAISTGGGFLSGSLAYIDCQARTIGSYGYGGLADPNSFVFAALTGLLTIFVAFYGIRLLLGHVESAGNTISDVIKVGIVLTLATSWPAWRIMGFDVIMNGPIELVQTIGLASGISGDIVDLTSRLQAVDDGIVVITSYGTGRLTGGVPAGDELGESFRGVALADQFALGMGRTAFLVGVLVPFGIFRLGAGILLALAPLMAGLLLFGSTIGIFVGWIRSLAFCILGFLGQLLVQGVEISLLEPWLQSVIANRQGGALAPSAPTELFVLCLAFSGISLGLFALFARLSFFRADAKSRLARRQPKLHWQRAKESELQTRSSEISVSSRAQIIAESVAVSMRREQPNWAQTNSPPPASRAAHPSSSTEGADRSTRTAGAAKRRTIERSSAAARFRDSKL